MAVIKLQNESDIQLGQYYEFDPEDRYSILGKGGMGIVFKGKLIHSETGVNELVAIKVLFKDLSEESILRARREASIQIVHENVIRMYGFVETTDGDGKPRYHVISEFLDGEPLSERLKKSGILQQSESLKIVKNVLAALYMLHGKGYVHRDIDPSNVMVCKDGKIKIIDFGIARKMKEYHDEFQQGTQEGKFIGKVNYASPEQARGEHWLTNATSDIYSVGVLLFELLTGKLPFSGTTYQIIKGHLEQPLPESEIQSEDLQYVVRKATNKLQAERYQSASEFIVDIEKIENGRSPIPIPRKKWIYVLSAAMVVLLFCVGGWIFFDKKQKQYSEYLLAGADKLSVALYDDALVSYKNAYTIKKTDSVALIIDMLNLLTPAVKEYINSQYSKADSLFKMSAAKNSSDAYYYLGEMCYEGIGVPKDFKKGFDYTIKAAKLGNQLAEYRLGLIYQNGLDVKADKDKAIGCFEKAGQMADKGIALNNPELQFVKGNMFRWGNGVQKNEKRAIEYYTAAANQGYPQAQYALYEVLSERDSERATEWLIKSARQEYPKAQFKYGTQLLGQQRYKEGLEWTCKAAEKNYSPAMRQLGAIYQDREKSSLAISIQQSLGIDGNDSVSHYYTKKALDYDFDNYLAMYELAVDYAKGNGVTRNIEEAEKYFKMAKQRIESLPYREEGNKRIYDSQHPFAEEIRLLNYQQYLK